MKALYKKILTMLVFSLLLVGCSSKKIKVGYTVYPVKFLFEEIGQDKVETYNFADDQMILRSQLSIDYKDILNEVDSLFIIGELEPYLDIISQDIADAKTNIIDLSLRSGVSEFSRFTKVNIDNKVIDVLNNYYENPIFDTIDTYTNDPYLWQDPIIMTSLANQVRDYLVLTDPDSTDFYNENFEKLKIKLAYLDANYLELRDNEINSFATMTPSYGVWQSNYDFSISPIILSKYGVLPTKQQLEIIKVRLVNDNVSHLIIDNTLDADVNELAESLAKDLGLEKVYLSNLAVRSASEKESDLDYIQIMNANLSVLESLSINDVEIEEDK